MIYDRQEMAIDYATCYADKSRITFIEKYFSTFNAIKGKKTQFHCFPRQRAFLKALSENRNVVAVKPRQCGITTLSSAWAAAQCAFAPKDAPETILCIANKLEQAQEIIIKVRDFLEQVPRWYWGDEYFSPDPNSDKNITSIFLKDAKGELKLFNGCRVIARASGPNASRGISAVSVLILDEAAFIEEGVAAFTTAAATMASNPNSKTVMVSTPNGKDELYYNTYRQALSHENNFVAVQFRWYQDPRFNKYLVWKKKNEETGEWMFDQDPIVDHEGSVKYDEERWARLEHDGWKPDAPWYDEMCKQFNNDSMKIAQELDVSFMGSNDNVIAPEFIEMQEKLNVREPLEDFKDPLVEETWFWKLPIEGHRYILACDPSRGTAADRTAIEIIDMDGRDENGVPIIEQVAEYVGKKLGDDIGAIAYQYATMYNDAFVVVDATGGQGDAAIITMLQMGYKNMYYEDMNQKTYMLQRATKIYDSYTDKLPGFHFQGNRYPVLANFAGLVRNNEFKIRSARVINELDTWIFKGDNARMDHMDGAHDDTITSLAMGLFVMQYSFNRLQSTIKKDKAILNAYMMTNSFKVKKPQMGNGRDMSPGIGLPFYKQDKMKNSYGSTQYGNCMWLFGGYK
jgi:hypothetical protein